MSLILKDADEAAIAPYLSEGSASLEALRQSANQRRGSDIKSEASALRALLDAGAEALRERVLDAPDTPNWPLNLQCNQPLLSGGRHGTASPRRPRNARGRVGDVPSSVFCGNPK